MSSLNNFLFIFKGASILNTKFLQKIFNEILILKLSKNSLNNNNEFLIFFLSRTL